MKDEGNPKKKRNGKNQEFKIPKLSLALGLLVLIALVVYVYKSEGDPTRFVLLLKQAKPLWLIVAAGLQVGTYMSVGLIWRYITRQSNYYVPLGALARLSLEKLSVDQFIPALGISGNLIVYQALKRLKIPRSLALEAILINILAHYIAYALVTAVALLAIIFLYHVTAVLLMLIGLFSIILIAVPMTVLWMVKHKDKKLPSWMMRFQAIVKGKKLIQSVSPKQIFSLRLITVASVLNVAVFILDSCTLWAVLHSLGLSVSLLTGFIALTIASVAATLSALPGGIGGFEAASVALLKLMGVPLEAALTSTLILRGFTLWIPLLPGLILARKDALIKSKS